MNCPRPGCKNKAIEDVNFGVLPCQSCREKDTEIASNIKKAPEFYNITKQTRIVEQRDKFKKDIEQPWIGKDFAPNPEFVKMYPKEATKYFTKEQLKKL